MGWGNNATSGGVFGQGSKYCFYAQVPSGSIAYGTSSSIRWKENIQPIDEVLNKVLQLRGVSFNWTEERGGGHDIGMIAEEVGKVFPEVVQYEADGKNAEGMDYGKLTTVLVEAVKEQQKQINALKAEIEELKKK